MKFLEQRIGKSQMGYRQPNILRYMRIQYSAICLIALFCSPTYATDVLHYANTCVEQESGDVAGYVVTVQAAARGRQSA
jgi:hypothetical protein